MFLGRRAGEHVAGHGGRSDQSRLSVRRRASARRPRPGDRHVRRDLPRRRGAARLRRAHQHHRQHQDPRLRHPPRAGLLPKATPSTARWSRRPRPTSRRWASSRRSMSRAEPGSAPDKVVLNIAVAEQSTGDYGVTAGYDSAVGHPGRAVARPSATSSAAASMSRPRSARARPARRFDFSFTEPHFMGLKMSAGIDLYHHITDETSTNIYGTTSDRRPAALRPAGHPRPHGAAVHRPRPDGRSPTRSAPTSTFFTDGAGPQQGLGRLQPDLNTLDDQKHPTEGLYAHADAAV